LELEKLTLFEGEHGREHENEKIVFGED